MSIFSTCNQNRNSLMESTEVYNSLDTLEEGVFKYTPSMVPVAARNTAEGTKYLVEFDMLQKLAAYNNMGIVEAYESVVEENSIDTDDVYVYVGENTTNSLMESYIGDYESGIAASINYQINRLSENGINILKSETPLQEIAKLKLFKFEKVATEHPEINKIKKELIDLNKYATGDVEFIYKNESDFWASVLKVLRVLYSIDSIIGLIAGPFSFFFTWIAALIDKVIIHAIDNDNANKTYEKAMQAAKELEKIADKCDDDQKKQEILNKVEDIRTKAKKLIEETDD